ANREQKNGPLLPVEQRRQADRTIDFPAVLIDVARSSWLAIGVTGEEIGVEIGAPHVLVNSAVHTIGAGLDRDVDDAACRPADLSVVDAALHAKFLGGFR